MKSLELKFSPNVMLIDVAFLNVFAFEARQYLGKMMGRELSPVDLPAWLTYLALDAGLRGEDNEILVLLLHDEDTRRLNCSEPSELKSLDGMACRTALGEFTFCCVSPAQVVERGELFTDLMTLALDAADVERLMLVPHEADYGPALMATLARLQADADAGKSLKKLHCFLTTEPADAPGYDWGMVFYSLGHAFGIRPDEA